MRSLAHRPHNPKVAGSNPAPATTQKARKLSVSGSLQFWAGFGRSTGVSTGGGRSRCVGGVRVGRWPGRSGGSTTPYNLTATSNDQGTLYELTAGVTDISSLGIPEQQFPSEIFDQLPREHLVYLVDENHLGMVSL